MQTYNNIASAIFDFLLAPFGHEIALFDLIVWPVIMGIGALQVYKYTSNQDAIARDGVLEPSVNFLQKPYTLSKLGETVRRALDSR